MFVRASLYMRREEDQLDATEWFIALVICSTCFGHLYAHHRELETILCYYRIWCVMAVRCRAAGYAFGMREAARLVEILMMGI